MTDKEFLKNLRYPSEDKPLRILMSACMVGHKCGYDSKSYTEYDPIKKLKSYNNIHLIPFCPEDYAFGTPRPLSDCHEGDGHAVLDGRARVLTESGEDWTEAMIEASLKMLSIAQEHNIELAVLLDVSAACGSQVIYLGNRKATKPLHQIGMGVCAAQLHRNGFKVISQRDFYSMELLFSRLDPNHQIDTTALDHDQHPWVLDYFGK